MGTSAETRASFATNEIGMEWPHLARSFIRPEMEEGKKESPWVGSVARSSLDPWLASRRFPCPSQTDRRGYTYFPAYSDIPLTVTNFCQSSVTNLTQTISLKGEQQAMKYGEQSRMSNQHLKQEHRQQQEAIIDLDWLRKRCSWPRSI